MTTTSGADTVTVRRGSLALDVHVAGPPDGAPVLLLHGFPQRADSWDELAPLLHAHGYRTLAPDQRGYSPGARPRRRREYTMDRLVADAVAVLDDLVGDAPVHVVGHDWGAVIAWLLAAHHPERVRSLCALSVPHPGGFLTAVARPSQLAHSWYMLFFQLPWLPERVAATRLGARWLELGGQRPDRAARDTARLRTPDALRGPLNYYRAMPLADPRSTRREVRRPTLFVWSDGDAAITGRAARGAGRWVAGAPFEFHTLSGVSHWIPEEAPDRVAELLVPHLERWDG